MEGWNVVSGASNEFARLFLFLPVTTVHLLFKLNCADKIYEFIRVLCVSNLAFED